jgi:hypothetical protein
LDEWLIWKLWKGSKETLKDLRYNYTYNDLLQMNSVLEMEDEYKLAYEQEEYEKRQKK